MATLPFTYREVMRFCDMYSDRSCPQITIRMLSSKAGCNLHMYKYYLPKVEKASKEIQIRKLIGVPI